MCTILDMYGLPEKFVRIIKHTYDGFSCVRTTEGMSSFFSSFFNVWLEFYRQTQFHITTPRIESFALCIIVLLFGTYQPRLCALELLPNEFTGGISDVTNFYFIKPKNFLD